MTRGDLRKRFRVFCVNVIQLAETLPKSYSGQVIARQIIRCSTSSAANYSAVCRAKSQRDFINKLKIVGEELDETEFWLDIIIKTDLLKMESVLGLNNETNELLSIIVSSLKTIKSKKTFVNRKSN